MNGENRRFLVSGGGDRWSIPVGNIPVRDITSASMEINTKTLEIPVLNLSRSADCKCVTVRAKTDLSNGSEVSPYGFSDVRVGDGTVTVDILNRNGITGTLVVIRRRHSRPSVRESMLFSIVD